MCTFISREERSTKRQKPDPFNEAAELKQIRDQTFSHWSCSASFRSRMIAAGFFSCNINDRVICLYCDIICEQWNIEIHDPCQIHTILSPHCIYVQSIFCYDLCQLNKNTVELPRHIDYMDPEKRSASFSTCSNNKFPSVDKLVDAGFFYNGSKILCFYCNGSFMYWQTNNYSITEHVRCFPYCNYARQLCGEELYHKIQGSAIEHCGKNRLQFEHNNFIDNGDLRMACEILQKRIDNLKDIIVVQSYIDELSTFENEHQGYKTTRQTMGAEFTEENTISVQRERLLNKQLHDQPPPTEMIKGGWITFEKEKYSECPHCHIKYYNWKSGDNPLLIHKYLSPLCLFVLSTNPFNSYRIPIRKGQEYYTDEYIENASSQPYAGLVRCRNDVGLNVSQRRDSFNRFPGGCPNDADQMAFFGLYYTRDNKIRCFHCKFSIPILNPFSRYYKLFTSFHLRSKCPYIQQMNDNDPVPSIEQTSNKCVCCMIEEKRLAALPCRHICVCESCGQIKRLCPKCNKDVTAYITVYPS